MSRFKLITSDESIFSDIFEALVKAIDDADKSKCGKLKIAEWKSWVFDGKVLSRDKKAKYFKMKELAEKLRQRYDCEYDIKLRIYKKNKIRAYFNPNGDGKLLLSFKKHRRFMPSKQIRASF